MKLTISKFELLAIINQNSGLVITDIEIYNDNFAKMAALIRKEIISIGGIGGNFLGQNDNSSAWQQRLTAVKHLRKVVKENRELWPLTYHGGEYLGLADATYVIKNFEQALDHISKYGTIK